MITETTIELHVNRKLADAVFKWQKEIKSLEPVSKAVTTKHFFGMLKSTDTVLCEGVAEAVDKIHGCFLFESNYMSVGKKIYMTDSGDELIKLANLYKLNEADIYPIVATSVYRLACQVFNEYEKK